jgi:hypothetical protein
MFLCLEIPQAARRVLVGLCAGAHKRRSFQNERKGGVRLTCVVLQTGGGRKRTLDIASNILACEALVSYRHANRIGR